MKFIWAKDSWTSTCKTSDKLEHFNAGFMGTITLLVLWPQWWFVWVPLSFVMAVLWEVKDALYNPENCSTSVANKLYMMSVCRQGEIPPAGDVENFKRDVIKDLVEFRDGSWWGHILLGDGFSWRDMLCTWAGILVAWLLTSIGG